LKRLGLSASDLMRMDPTEAFKKISDGMVKIPSTTERAGLAMEIFGKGGIKVLNTLGAGSAELNRLEAAGESLGQTVSQVDAAKIGAVKDSMDNAWKKVESFTTSLAIGLAPAINAVASVFTTMFATISTGGVTFDGVIKFMLKGVAWVADAAWTLKLSFQKVMEAIVWAASKAASVISASLAKSLRTASQDIGKDIQKSLEAGAPGDKILSKYDEYKNKLDETAKASAALSKEQLELGRTITGTAKATKEMEELGKWAENLEKEVQTPLQKYQSQISHIGEALAEGFISQDTAEKASKKAFADLKIDEPKFAGAVELGSKEFRSSALAATSGRTEPGKVMQTIATNQLTEAQKQTAVLNIIAGANKGKAVEMAL
jgi:hypothetical protein